MRRPELRSRQEERADGVRSEASWRAEDLLVVSRSSMTKRSLRFNWLRDWRVTSREAGTSAAVCADIAEIAGFLNASAATAEQLSQEIWNEVGPDRKGSPRSEAARALSSSALNC